MRQIILTLAQETKKQVRIALAQHHPDKGGSGNRAIYDQIKPLFDQCNDILAQVDTCPTVMLNPLKTRLNGLQGQLQAILIQPIPKPAPKPKTAAQPGFKPSPKPQPAPKPTPKPAQSPLPTLNPQPKPKPTSKPQPAKPQPATATPKNLKPSLDPTKQLYSQLGDITEFLNKTLFGNVLPLPVIRLQVKPNMLGYMTSSKNWQYGQTQITTYEMGLNPAYFQNRPLIDVFNTIAHELCHEFCSEVHGSSTTYHDRKWQKEALNIGLRPVGKGVSVDTEIISGGLTEQAYHSFMRQHPGFSIDWFNASIGQGVTGGNGKSKQKFTCPKCKQNAWAKPTAKIICGNCLIAMQ